MDQIIIGSYFTNEPIETYCEHCYRALQIEDRSTVPMLVRAERFANGDILATETHGFLCEDCAQEAGGVQAVLDVDGLHYRMYVRPIRGRM